MWSWLINLKYNITIYKINLSTHNIVWYNILGYDIKKKLLIKNNNKKKIRMPQYLGALQQTPPTLEVRVYISKSNIYSIICIMIIFCNYYRWCCRLILPTQNNYLTQ